MKLALMCHQHPDQPTYHVLLDADKLDAVDYKSVCFVRFVEPDIRVTECPRCGAVHQHEQVPA